MAHWVLHLGKIGPPSTKTAHLVRGVRGVMRNGKKSVSLYAMKERVDNTILWNSAAKVGLMLGAVSVGCLTLKEAAGTSGNSFLQQAATIILWAVEFFGCILILKNQMLSLRDKYADVKIEHTYLLGRRSALLSGLVLASAQALFVMQMPEAEVDTLISGITDTMNLTAQDREAVDGMMDKLPLFIFGFQWFYCYLYGTLLSGFLSRYIFLKKLFSFPPKFPEDQDQKPDEQ